MKEIIDNATQLLRIQNHVHHRIIEQVVQQSTGISHSQHLLLMQLYWFHFTSQKEIAAKLNISPAAVTMALKKLESEGYVQKNINPEDTRFNFVELTEKGEKVVSFSKELFRVIDTKIFEGFSEDELKTLCAFLERIIRNTKEIEETRPFEDLHI